MGSSHLKDREMAGSMQELYKHEHSFFFAEFPSRQPYPRGQQLCSVHAPHLIHLHFRVGEDLPVRLFERYLTVWVGLGIAAGVGLGLWVPGLFQTVAALEFAHVNLVVAVFIWVSGGSVGRPARTK